MELVRLPADESAVRRYMEDLWIPYNRELEEMVDHFSFVDDDDLIEAERTYWLDRLESESFEGWIAVDGPQRAGNLTDIDGEFAGFITTDVEECPDCFDYADRLAICDLYVREPYRGTGLADRLVDRARERAREQGCSEFRLEVNVENDRALAFYERLGFETFRYNMVASVEE